MITYKTLDEKLRMLNSTERYLQKHPGYKKDYSQLPQISKDGYPAYVFSKYPEANDIDSRIMRKFAIQKHTRFSSVPMHIHSYIELSYVYSGCFPQTIMDNNITLEEGQICLLDTDVPHQIKKPGKMIL